MALSDHTLIAAYPLGSGIADLQDSYDGYSAQNMTFAGDGDLSGLPVADFNSSYYGVDNDLYNGFDTEYSFSMWMKPDTIAHSWLMNNEQHGSYYATWGVLLQADGQLHLFVRNANGGAYDIARTGVSLVVDEWSHVAATWNGTEIKWYVDGALVSTTAASRIPWNSPATLWIGANATKSGVQKYYFDGKMSDLRFWYSELTASDVAELHAAGQVPIDLGMDAKYALDTDATDSVGSANGTASGVTFSTSAGRSFADFGANSYIDLGVSSGFDISGAGDFSVSAWINPDSLSLPFGQIAGSVVSGASSPANAGWQLAINQGVLRFRVGGSGSHEDLDYTLPVDVAGSWNHVTATRDGTSVKLYLNGVEVASGTFASVYDTHTATAWHKMSIGGYYANSQWYTGYDGKIDDVRIWNRNLSAIEVESLHLATTVTPSLTDDLVIHHNCDDATAEIGEDVTFTDVSIGTSSGRTHWDFANLNSKAVLSDPNNLPDMSGDWTVSMWFSEMTAPTTWRSIARSQTENLGVVSSPSHSPANTLGVYTTTAFVSAGYSMNYLNFQNWNHMVIVGSGTTTKFYINGSHVGTAPVKISSDLYALNNTFSGNHSQLFANNMDDVRVWSRALSDSEVSTLHTGTIVTPSLTDDLVGVWNFDSADATDSVGSNDGTVTGVDFISDSGRTVASFDASAGEKIHFGDVDDVDFGTADFSVGVWVNFNSISSGAYTSPVVLKGQTSLANWSGYSLNAYQGQMRFGVGGNGGVKVATAAITTGDWHHVVGTRTGAAIKLYIDGSLVDTQADTMTRNVSTHLPLTFGSINNGTEYNGLLDAMVDDVRVWSRALSDSEVSTLHTETIVTPSLTDDLVHKWSLDTDGSAEVGSVDLVAHNSATHIDNVGSLPEVDSGFHPATSIALNPSAGYTISIWFKGLKSNAWNPFIAGGSSGTGGNHAGSTAYYDIAFDSTDLHVWMQTSPYYRRSGYDMMSDTNLDTGWHNIVAAYSGTQTIFYVDGVQVGNPVTWSGSPSIQTFGSWKNTTDRAPADFMDDIRVWSRTLSASEVTALHAAGAEAPSGAYDWTHGGNLSDIVKFSRGSDISGNPSYAYAKKEPGDDTTTLYFATDFQTWSTFSSYASGVSSIDGSPICMEYGPNGKVLVGTDSGKVYEITLDGSSVPQSYSLVHSMAGSEDIKVIKYGTSSNLWAFEAGGKVYTIPVGGGAAVEKLDLNVVDQAGSIVQDMSEANDAWSIVVRRPDFTFVVYLVSPDWSTVNNPASLQAVLSAINPVDLNYFYDIDTWCASGADGTVITTDDINNWIA